MYSKRQNNNNNNSNGDDKPNDWADDDADNKEDPLSLSFKVCVFTDIHTDRTQETMGARDLGEYFPLEEEERMSFVFEREPGAGGERRGLDDDGEW